MSFNWSQFIQTAKGEVRERLQALNDGLLRLEGDSGNEALIDEVFRHAHSIKGSAQMVGLDMVGRVAHGLENLLGAVRAHRLQISPPLLDLGFEALDTIQSLLDELPSEAAQEKVEAISHRLEAAAEGMFEAVKAPEAKPPQVAPAEQDFFRHGPVAPPASERTELVPQQKSTESPPQAIFSPARPTSLSTAPPDEIRPLPPSDVIRVPIGQVDRLLSLVGELSRFEQWHRALLRSARELQRELHAFCNRKQGPTGTQEELQSVLSQVSSLVQQARRLNTACGLFVQEMRTAATDLRLLPVSTLFDRFPRHVRDLARAANKEIRLVIEGEETRLDKHVLDELYDPLLHLVRNAVDHGIESTEERRLAGKPEAGAVTLRAIPRGRTVLVQVCDDGRGIDREKVRRVACDRAFVTPAEAQVLSEDQLLQLLFRPGFSTAEKVTAVSGRGVGLDVVRNNVHRLKGTVRVETEVGKGTTFTLEIPLTLVTTRVLLFECENEVFAVPVSLVRAVGEVTLAEVQHVHGQPTVIWGRRTVPLFALESVLWGRPPRRQVRRTAVLLEGGGRLIGLVADRLLDEEEVVLKPLGKLLRSASLVSAGAVGEDSRVVLLLDIEAVVAAAERQRLPSAPKEGPPEARRHAILLADDALTTRELERAILEAAGYEVTAVPDGQEAWKLVTQRPFDLVIADVEMPQMDGITLTRQITSDERTAHIPVILITSLSSEEDRRRGLEAGAAAYIVKSAFNQENLLDLIERLLP